MAYFFIGNQFNYGRAGSIKRQTNQVATAPRAGTELAQQAPLLGKDLFQQKPFPFCHPYCLVE